MFETIASFSMVYWPLALLLFFLILFEKKLIAFEERKKAEREAKVKDLEKIVYIQDRIIDLQFKKVRKLNRALSTQKKINSINLEELRQERLRNSREVKR